MPSYMVKPDLVGIGADRRGMLSVGKMIGLLTFLPLCGLAVIFSLFWFSAHRVGSELGRSRINIRTSLDAKTLRDRIVAAERAMGVFIAKPSADSRAALLNSQTAIQQPTAGIDARLAAATDQTQSLSGSLDAIVAAQDAIGYDDQTGFAAKTNLSGDALGSVLSDTIDYSDPLGSALVEAFSKLRRAQYKFAVVRTPAAHDDFAAATTFVRKDIDASFFSDDKKAVMLKALAVYEGSFEGWTREVGALATAQGRADDAFRQMIAASDGVVLSASQAADETQSALAKAQDESLTLVAVTIGLVIVVCGGASLLIGRRLSVPITRLATVMRRMAGGDLDVTIEGAGRRDEIGAMARAVESFRQAGLQKLTLEHEADRSREGAERDQAARETEKASEAEADHAVVAALGAGLRRLADGDLMTRLSVPFAPKAEALRLDFNATVDRLQSALLMVDGTARTIRSRTIEISTAAEDLSRRTEQQAASLEEAAASLDVITSTTRQAAAGMGNVKHIASGAKADADHGAAVVAEAIGAMESIEQSAKHIMRIIGVIDEIAFQTNLLALNAGVEAARAGDSGRGFAVVASEVRALAQRSAEAARDIKSLISKSSAQVGHGVQLVGTTGEALERIRRQVSELTTSVSAIAITAQDQADGLTQINGAVSRMDGMTQQNAAMVEETTAASQSLAHEAEELARLVGHFQTGTPDKFQQVRQALASPPASRRPAPGTPSLKLVRTRARPE